MKSIQIIAIPFIKRVFAEESAKLENLDMQIGKTRIDRFRIEILKKLRNLGGYIP